VTDWPDGVGLSRHDCIDSTNEEARRLAQSGERGPLWIVAREQTAGRGRRGRPWVSQAGNLFATMLLRASPWACAQLGFAAGLAVYDVIGGYGHPAPVALKWPNDVLLGGKKVAGILLEALGSDRLGIGIGINLAHHPVDMEFPATSLKMITGRAPDAEEALVILARSMAAWYEVWRVQGFAKGLRGAWIERAAGLHQEIRARFDGGEMQGVFEGLDEDGALLLRRRHGGLERVTAADIFFR
jgi:BirA family transcriptional regulator, biotin operon repressor / biotin---[acetyl-CoA-carboxylase] ligase